MSEAESEAPWQKFLSRWALAYGLYEVAVLVAFATVVGFDELGSGAFDAAGRSPATFRLGAGLDLTAWLWIGSTLLVFAGLFARSVPMRVASASSLFGDAYPDAVGRVPLLARRAPVRFQNTVDEFHQRSDFRPWPLLGRSLPGHRVCQRLSHQPTLDAILARHRGHTAYAEVVFPPKLLE